MWTLTTCLCCFDMTNDRDRLNARKSLRKRTRPSDQHILPIISSLHEAQSQTQRGPGECTVRVLYVCLIFEC